MLKKPARGGSSRGCRWNEGSERRRSDRVKGGLQSNICVLQTAAMVESTGRIPERRIDGGITIKSV